VSGHPPTRPENGRTDSRNQYWRFLAIAAGSAFVILAALAARIETPTIDEFAHVPAGCLYWTEGRFDLYSKNPPLLKMAMTAPLVMAGATVPPLRYNTKDNWAPWLYGYEFMVANPRDYLALFSLARFVPIICGLLTGVILFRWVREWFDMRAASLTTTLFYLNPNVLAHSHLATVDAGSMFTILWTLYLLHVAYQRPATWRIAVAGAGWGVALLTKFTAVALLPVLLAMIAFHRWRMWKAMVIEGLIVLATAALTVNLVMTFHGSFESVGSYQFSSDVARTAQTFFPAAWKVPFPREWIVGLDLQTLDAENGEYDNYLFGEWSQRGWWYYNFVALAVKNPLSFLGLLIVAPRFWCGTRLGRLVSLEVILPLLIMLVSVATVDRLNIGVRYLLPAFPLMFLLSAAVWRGRQRWQPSLATVVVTLHAVSAVWMYPGYLGYFNIAVGGPSNGYRVLADSNIDWGQDLYRLPAVLKGLRPSGPIKLLYFGHVEPRLYGIQYELPSSAPAEGVFAVSTQYLVGGTYIATAPNGRLVEVDGRQVEWLRKIEPIERAGSLWIFDTRRRVNP